MTTKERILEEALTLFSRQGYKATGVRQIAAAVGIRDASLYKHFKSKEDIFRGIMALIEEHIGGFSPELGLPRWEGESLDADTEPLVHLDLETMKAISRKAFLFYLTDPYLSRFRRLAHLERYREPEIYRRYYKLFMEDAVSYLPRLFEVLMKRGTFRQGDPRGAALHYYAPIYFLLDQYEGCEERVEEAATILDQQIEAFYSLYHQ